jgi:hypothetical protein
MTITEFYHRVDLNGGLDRKIDEWKIIDIHQIPEILSEQDEVDFYCCNDNEVFLLRIRNRLTKKLDIVKGENRFDAPTYLIAELPIKRVDSILLKNILNEFINIEK